MFWLEPAEAAHDWPDFGDVMARQLQAVIMAKHMTGEEVEIEKRWMDKLLSFLDPVSGIIVRPGNHHDKSICFMGDQTLTLYACKEICIGEVLSFAVSRGLFKIAAAVLEPMHFLLSGRMLPVSSMKRSPFICISINCMRKSQSGIPDINSIIIGLYGKAIRSFGWNL